jgi:hypothetical protein
VEAKFDSTIWELQSITRYGVRTSAVQLVVGGGRRAVGL